MTYHPELGEIKILLEYNSEKNFKLVKAYFRVDYDWYGTRRFVWSNKSRYYVLWGNSTDLENMGITELLTPSGRRPSVKSCINKFYTMLKNSEHVNFKK